MPKRSVAIVDDDPAHLFFSQIALEDRYEVSTIQDSMDAARQLAILQPDLIFLDMMMPSKDGLGVGEELILAAPQLIGRVIVNTADPSNPRAQLLLALGAHSIVLKHADVDELLELTSSVLAEFGVEPARSRE